MKNKLNDINLMDGNSLVIVCPPLEQCKLPPIDQSKCFEKSCPYCEKSMWLSEKKSEKIEECQKLKVDYILICYQCLGDYLKQLKKIKGH